jgi:hypothetical protein
MYICVYTYIDTDTVTDTDLYTYTLAHTLKLKFAKILAAVPPLFLYTVFCFPRALR